ncbi:type II secretion system protein GspG [Lutimonas halocynthiae]|uniref:type II secretion system protein GspG n=1 Tax=Lutimonas halocynthiae TaxID=1446477 RepID=UPI0025B56E4B|nr:type II secretion system protein GspG [Lutimonas halocynthiae]MDN3643365.1 type II secretion system protein GspG [Lutimonas halocynthiae]
MSEVLGYLLELVSDFQFWKKKKERRKHEKENNLPKKLLVHSLTKVVLFTLVLAVVVKLVVGGIYISNRYENETKRKMDEILILLEENRKYSGRYPKELKMIIRNNPLRKNITLDSWGNEFHYESLSNGLNYVLLSKGKDGELGNEDDIES